MMISAEEAKSLLAYDPKTGAFARKARGGKIVKGATDSHGYAQIRLNGKLYLAHRLAWLLHHGVWPADQVDHVNGNRADNRMSNLRLASGSVNQRNAKRRKDNTSGVPGVVWHKPSQRWLARLSTDCGVKYLGYFSDKEAAIKTRLTAAEAHGYHANHGRENNA